jgi:hypothetical protein
MNNGKKFKLAFSLFVNVSRKQHAVVGMRRWNCAWPTNKFPVGLLLFDLLARHPPGYAAFQQWRVSFGRIPTTAKITEGAFAIVSNE